MKKIIIFLSALFVLIVSEYYLLNELFAQRRLPVLLTCLAALGACVFVFLRFFKKTIVSA